MGQNSRLRFGALVEGASAIEHSGQAFTDRNHRSLISAEFEHKAGPAVAIASAGVLQENGSLLGSQQGRALALNVTPKTTFAALSAGYSLSPASTLVAMLSAGKSAGFSNPDSLVSHLSSVSTVACSVGLARSKIFSQADRFGLTLSMPAKVRSGTMA